MITEKTTVRAALLIPKAKTKMELYNCILIGKLYDMQKQNKFIEKLRKASPKYDCIIRNYEKEKENRSW